MAMTASSEDFRPLELARRSIAGDLPLRYQRKLEHGFHERIAGRAVYHRWADSGLRLLAEWTHRKFQQPALGAGGVSVSGAGGQRATGDGAGQRVAANSVLDAISDQRDVGERARHDGGGQHQ